MFLTVFIESTFLLVDTKGVVCIGRTRVTLDTVVKAFLEGATAEAIAERYPSLQLTEVYSVIGYYLRHRAEIDRYLETRRQNAEEVRRENERHFNPIGIRDRLLARRSRSAENLFLKG